MAEYLGYSFVDAADCVFFTYDGQVDREKTDAAIASVGADGKANHTVFANDAPELKYVRAGYTFAGWKLTKANPDPNPAPGGKGTVIAPRAYAANGLLTGGDVIDVDSNIVLTAQWTKKTSPDPDKDLDKPLSPGTGESAMPMVFAFNFAILSMLAIGTVLRKRRAR